MKVMVLSPYLPHARVGHGGGTAVRDLVTWLAKDHQVLLVSLLRPGEDRYVGEVETLGTDGSLQVAVIPFADNMAQGSRRVGFLANRLLAAGRAAKTGYPLYVTKYWSGRISRQVRKLASEFQPDAIQIEYLQLALLCRDLRRWREAEGTAKPTLILNSHELGSVPRERRAARTANPFLRLASLAEAAAWRRLQIEASGWADTTVCVTEGDHQKYQAMGGMNLATVPLGMDIQNISADWAPEKPDRYLFVGSFGHRPNELAAQFLLQKVWPVLAKSDPEAKLILAGRGSDTWLNNWLSRRPGKGQGVEALGFVADIAPLFRQSKLFLAPLGEGGGIKIKILEAMARGIPVVTTPIGAEGICGPEDEALFLSECDSNFAMKAQEAGQDSAEARKRAARARKLIEEKFSWKVITSDLVKLYHNNQG